MLAEQNSIVHSDRVHRDWAANAGDTLRFGDGEFGQIPGDETKFRVRYRSGPGTAANVNALIIRVVNDPRVPEQGTVVVTVREVVAAARARVSREPARSRRARCQIHWRRSPQLLHAKALRARVHKLCSESRVGVELHRDLVQAGDVGPGLGDLGRPRLREGGLADSRRAHSAVAQGLTALGLGDPT
ncbi:hypothetical protein DB30_04567 [Enhygromyxa salina]|uniref:Uncharacterized protein n=1 Tax=Enhygromyxa salina TaxID=215803 RepID=A0A0C2DHD0_9BACT|nr:hypothetical protein [Enhygromyxa salina]KIG19102.1 hypothetical protein DB30_04567 [Enhygromyxa salina]